MNAAHSAVVAPQFERASQQKAAATLGVWVFLATEIMFFGPLFLGYTYGRTHFPEAFAAASRHTQVAIGTLNTAVLLTSSLCMAIAVVARRIGDTRLTQRLLWSTVFLGLAFLALKSYEYSLEWQEHLFPGDGFSFPGNAQEGVQIFFILYFAMTGLHALHMVIGIMLVGIFALGLRRNSERFATAERIELTGLYWHFIDCVWIFLYPILYLVGRSAG
jgi:cytochrome c oxidase subunit III